MSAAVSYSSCVRGRVFKHGRTWYYEVGYGGEVYLTDNTGSFAPILRDCLRDVAVLRRIYGAGHVLQHAYAEITEQYREPR